MTQDRCFADHVKNERVTFARLRLIVEAVQARTSLPDLIGQYVQLRGATIRRYVADCPFHDDESSFVVSDAGWYYCTAPLCRASGDALSFIAAIEGGVSLSGALRELAGRAGVEVPDRIDLAASDDHIRLKPDPTAIGLIAQEVGYGLKAGVATQRAKRALRAAPELLDSDDGRAIVAEAIYVIGEDLRRYARGVTDEDRATTSETHNASASELAAALADLRRAKADLRVQRVRSERAYSCPKSLRSLAQFAQAVEHDHSTWPRR